MIKDNMTQTRTENTILLADAYKNTHFLQYPENTKVIYSYLESRGGYYNETMFFGLQMILKKYFYDQLNLLNLLKKIYQF